jgi:hypothetical protein
MNMHELLLLIFWCLMENFLVEKPHVLAAAMVACNEQAIIGNE